MKILFSVMFIMFTNEFLLGQVNQNVKSTKNDDYLESPNIDSLVNELSKYTWIPITDWIDSSTNSSDNNNSTRTINSGERRFFINATRKNISKLVFTRNNKMTIWNKRKSEEYHYRLYGHSIILGRHAITTFDFVLIDDELTIGDYYNRMTRYIKFKKRK